MFPSTQRALLDNGAIAFEAGEDWGAIAHPSGDRVQSSRHRHTTHNAGGRTAPILPSLKQSLPGTTGKANCQPT